MSMLLSPYIVTVRYSRILFFILSILKLSQLQQSFLKIQRSALYLQEVYQYEYVTIKKYNLGHVELFRRPSPIRRKFSTVRSSLVVLKATKFPFDTTKAWLI
jgi:hypothetical protein